MRQVCGKPTVLDESLTGFPALLDAFAAGAMDVARLKLSRFGGITPLRKARDLCLAMGVGIAIEDSAGGDIVERRPPSTWQRASQTMACSTRSCRVGRSGSMSRSDPVDTTRWPCPGPLPALAWASRWTWNCSARRWPGCGDRRQRTGLLAERAPARAPTRLAARLLARLRPDCWAGSTILRIEHLSKHFGNLPVLNDISFDVSTGEVLCLIGPSGSGKSTLLRCVNYLETPTGGRITSTVSSWEPVKKRVGWSTFATKSWPASGPRSGWSSRASTFSLT